LPGPTNDYEWVPGNSDQISGWSTVLNGVEYADPRSTRPEVMSAGDPADGNFILDLAPLLFSGGGIEQSFPTVAGHLYHVSFKMGTLKRAPRDGTASLVVEAGDSTQTFTTENSSDQVAWSLKFFSFHALPGTSTTTLKFSTTDDAQYHFVDLDDVRVT